MMNPMNFKRDLMMNVNTSVAYVALAFSASCYGLWHLLANVAMKRGAPAIIFALYRCAGGMACCLLAMKLCPELGTKTRKEKGRTIFGDNIQSWYQERNGYSRKDELMFVALGLCMAGNICGFIVANTMLPAMTCSIFAPLVPVGTAIISIAWGIEDGNRTKLIGLGLAVFGAMVVVLFEQDHPVSKPVTTVTTLTTMMAKPLANASTAHVANATKAVANATLAKVVTNATGAVAANATHVAAAAAANATKVAAVNATGVVVSNATQVAVKSAATTVVRAAATTMSPAVGHAVQASAVAGGWKTMGYAFLFLSTFSAAMYFVLLKSALKTYTPVRATAMAYCNATGFILLAAVLRHGFEPSAWFLYGDGMSWLCLIYSAVITTGLTYTIQAWAVGQTTPSTVTAFATVSPMAAALLGSAFFDIHLQSYQLVGGALIMIGLWVNVTVQEREYAAKDKVPLLKPTEYGQFSYGSSGL